MADPALVALHQLRRLRLRHRLGELEWFDAAYRVYLLALFGGGTVLWLSGAIGDGPVSTATAADIAERGPAVLGIAAVVAFVIGLRGGAQGGPLALEAADVAHVMLAPVDRRRALLRPTFQRVRGACAVWAAIGAIAGQLAARRLPGSPAAWAAGGALFGLHLALLWAGSALCAHALHVRWPVITTVTIVAVAWQGSAAIWGVAGPADAAGSLGLWGWRQHVTDVVAVAISAALVGAGALALGRTSLDALSRRSGLVAQLRFAVTMQDLRTVVLLRRQLNQEHARRRPWLGAPGPRSLPPEWRRGWHGLLRLPAGRLGRMVILAAGAGITQGLVLRGTSPALVGSAVVLFILGLEVVEPLSQEIDQPDRTDALPVERGRLLARHLAAPAVVLLPFGALFAAGMAAVAARPLGTADAVIASAIIAVPTVWAGACAAVVSIVRDAPDLGGASTQAFVPPEMAGINNLIRVVLPLLVGGLGVATVLLIRVAADDGGPVVAAAIRAAVAALLVCGATVAWVRSRDLIRRRIRGFLAEGRAVTRERRTAR